MRIGILLMSWLCGVEVYAQPFQLAPPRFQYESVFFTDSTRVTLAFAKNNTQIYYVNSEKLPTENDNRYSKPITVKNTFTTLTARVFSSMFLPSDPVTVTFIKQGIPLTRIKYTKPNPLYSGSGVSTLYDNKGGLPDFSSEQWLGYDTDTVTFRLKSDQPRLMDSVLIHILEHPDAWIVAPARIEIFALNTETDSQLLLKTVDIPETQPDVIRCRPLLISFSPVETEELMISVYPVRSLPDWHPGKGNHAWFFVDEIKVY